MKNLLLPLATSLLLFSCARNPVTGEKELRIISESQERKMGKQAYSSMIQAQGGLLTIDPKLTQYVNDVGQKLAKQSDRPNLSYEFVIINDSTPNAWALPGGKIAINRGLLTELQSEAELAAVLGHEIVHAAARHGAKGMERDMLIQGGIIALGISLQDSRYNDVLIGSSAIASMIVMSKYSQDQELESDRYGMIYMAKAGYNPEAAVQLQKLFLKLSADDPNWITGLFASHPPSIERIKANEKTAKNLTGHFEGKYEYEPAVASLMEQKDAYKSYDAGLEALERKDYKKAARKAQNAIDSFKKEALFWHLLAQAQLGMHKPKKALASLDKAIELNPEYYDFYLKRAECKKLTGDLQGAKADAKKSAQLLPTGEAHELLGRLALKAGKTKQAIYHFEIASHANSRSGKRAKAYLKSLTS